MDRHVITTMTFFMEMLMLPDSAESIPILRFSLCSILKRKTHECKKFFETKMTSTALFSSKIYGASLEPKSNSKLNQIQNHAVGRQHTRIRRYCVKHLDTNAVQSFNDRDAPMVAISKVYVPANKKLFCTNCTETNNGASQ